MSAQAMVIPTATSARRAAGGRNGSENLDKGRVVAQSPSRINDADLIREAQQGNKAAFEELVRQYDTAVLRLALHLTNSEADAKDIYQEAFLKAYRNLGSFR